MTRKNEVRPRFEVTRYNGKDITTKTMLRQEYHDIAPQSVDHYLDLPHGILAFRTASGVWVPDGWRGIGNVSLAILQVIQRSPGEYITPEELAEETGYYTLRENNNVAARFAALRRAHRESHKAPHFFVSRRKGGLGVAWSHRRTWISVARAPSTGGDDAERSTIG